MTRAWALEKTTIALSQFCIACARSFFVFAQVNVARPSLQRSAA
jgi:hypothetical protein